MRRSIALALLLVTLVGFALCAYLDPLNAWRWTLLTSLCA